MCSSTLRSLACPRSAAVRVGAPAQPGERTLSVTCVDGQGNPVEANPRDERTLAAGIGLYFPVCFGPTAALGIVGLLLANGLLQARRRRAQPWPAA